MSPISSQTSKLSPSKSHSEYNITHSSSDWPSSGLKFPGMHSSTVLFAKIQPLSEPNSSLILPEGEPFVPTKARVSSGSLNWK